MVSMLDRKLLLNNFDYFTALVLSAMRAHTVWQLGLMAVGTLGEARSFQGVVRAAGTGALLGVSTFRIRHISFPLLLQKSSTTTEFLYYYKISDL